MQLIKQSTIQRFTLLMIALVHSAIMSAVWSPIIEHFSPQDYKAGTQNWDIVEQYNGWIYIANNYGLLEYDGSYWRLY